MFLVVGGAVDPYEVSKIVNNTLDKFSFDNKKNIKRKEYKEPLKVVKSYELLDIDVKVSKLALGYKMDRNRFSIKSNVLLDLYLNMIASLCFGSSSLFKEMIREKKLVSRSGYYFQNLGNIITFNVEVDSFNNKAYLEELHKYLKSLDILEEDLERMKKVWISSEVIKTDYADSLVDTVVDDLINYHEVVTNNVELIKSMNIATMRDVLKTLDFTNEAIVEVKCEK